MVKTAGVHRRHGIVGKSNRGQGGISKLMTYANNCGTIFLIFSTGVLYDYGSCDLE